jgi:hypothetical protein
LNKARLKHVALNEVSGILCGDPQFVLADELERLELAAKVVLQGRGRSCRLQT